MFMYEHSTAEAPAERNMEKLIPQNTDERAENDEYLTDRQSITVLGEQHFNFASAKRSDE